MRRMDVIDNYKKTRFSKRDFNQRQWDIIRLGKKNGVDVRVYAKPDFDEWKMFRIFEALKGGFEEIVHYIDDYDAGQLSQIYRVYKNGYPFGLILDRGYTFSQMYSRINEYEKKFIR